MEKTGGIYKILSNPLIYRTYQDLSGGSRARRSFIREHVKPLSRERLVDIGCGPGQLLDLMPQGISYFGFDLSAEYIEEARQKYQGRGS